MTPSAARQDPDLRMILETSGDLEVVGEAEDGRTAIEAARRLQPDVVLMDIRMPRMDGVAATAELHASDRTPAVIVITRLFEKLSATNRVQLAVAAFRAGLVG